MTLLSRHDTPASLRDMPAGSSFYDNWHRLIADDIAPTTAGSNGGGFYDATETDVNIIGGRSLVWMAFPRMVLVALRDNRTEAYKSAEERLQQNEYCEWRVAKNSAGKISKVTFTTEAPEYWEMLWNLDRSRVVALYNSLLGTTAVVESDLVDSGGNYDRQNRWNLNEGIIHLAVGENNLLAAIGISQPAVNTPGKRDNFEIPGGRSTSVDIRVALDIGTLARKGLWVTLSDPIGLYIAGWDDTGWTKPNGRPVENYWRIVRGRPGQVLRLEYEVPASAGFVVGDIRIGGRPIEWGGQIAEHVTVTIAGTAGTLAAPITPAQAESRGTDDKTSSTYIRRQAIEAPSIRWHRKKESRQSETARS